MKVITKLVSIENERFVLVYLEEHKEYGTISYNDIDEHGRLKRRINGLEMSLSKNINDCLETTRKHILLKKFINENNLDLENNQEDIKKYCNYIKELIK